MEKNRTMAEIRDSFMKLSPGIRKLVALNDICRIERGGGISTASDLDYNIYTIAKEILLSK